MIEDFIDIAWTILNSINFDCFFESIIDLTDIICYFEPIQDLANLDDPLINQLTHFLELLLGAVLDLCVVY